MVQISLRFIGKLFGELMFFDLEGGFKQAKGKSQLLLNSVLDLEI